jgi:phage terminase large subunit
MSGAVRFARAAHRAGCPRDQVENFLSGGYLPQPRQLQFHAAARAADHQEGPTPEIGFGGARGPGKSHGIMGQLVLDDARRWPGMRGLFLRSVGKAARESFQHLIVKVAPQYLRYYKSQAGVLDLPNGSVIILGGYRTAGDIANYLGLEYDVAAIEEATLLPEEYYTKLLGSVRTSRPGWRARAYNSTNPGSVGHAWYKRRFIEPWRRGDESATRFIFATYADNAYLQPGYIDYLHSLGGNLGRMWRDGDWDVATGQYFTTFREELHVREFRNDWHWRYWMAMDYGYAHYTVVYLLAQDGDGTVYVVDEHAERRWLVQSHAEAMTAMIRRHAVPDVRVTVAGSDVFAKRSDEATIAEQYARHGINLEAAQMDRVNGAAEVLKRLGDEEQGIAPSLVIHPRCARLIECLPMLQHDEHRPEDVKKWDASAEGEGGDDPYDALRYGLMEAADTGPRAVIIEA